MISTVSDMARHFAKAAGFVALVLVAGCNPTSAICQLLECGNSAAPVDSPGTFSYYAIVNYGDGSTFCPDQSTDCIYGVSNNLGTPMQNSKWTLSNGVTEAIVNGSWTADPTATSIINETANLLYVNSHGNVLNGNQAEVCLRNCNNSQFGNDYAWGPSDIPNPWNGPTWLVLDACDVVIPGVGWEGVFGGNLHGILGWNGGTYALSDGGLQAFARAIGQYSTALDAWDTAVAQTGDASLASALVPQPNETDDIEARGGPHYGIDRDTNPIYLSYANGSLQAQIAMLSSAPASTYALTGESMNETYWYNFYGGGSVASEIIHPTGNEDLYRNPYAYVDHYLASGGLVAVTPATGTAKGFYQDDALQYAEQWIASNGGQLPSHAVLTFGGAQTISPTTTAPTSDAPAPGNRQYMFVWRHGSSGLLGSDKIQINIDDAGTWTRVPETVGGTYNSNCQCIIPKVIFVNGPPWIPAFHVHLYTRLWRTIGAPLQPVAASGTYSAYALCGSDIGSTQSTASPCGAVQSGGRTILVDLSSGASYGSEGIQ